MQNLFNESHLPENPPRRDTARIAFRANSFAIS